MDKNVERVVENSLEWIQNEFDQYNPNIVSCLEPFHKIEFLDRLINSKNGSVIFIDLDLLYTGYIRSGMIQKKEGVSILTPNQRGWGDELSRVISKASKEKSLVIIDSLNGVYNLFSSQKHAQFIHSCIMLLTSFVRQSKSSVVITSMVRKSENNRWLLSPGGRYILQSKNAKNYLLRKNIDGLTISPL